MDSELCTEISYGPGWSDLRQLACTSPICRWRHVRGESFINLANALQVDRIRSGLR